MKILIPLDGSKFAEAVLTQAAKLARTTRAEVHLVTVIPETAAHITLKHEDVPESASFRGIDPMGIMRPSVVTSDISADMVEAKDTALERTIYHLRDYLTDVASRFPRRVVKTKVVVGDLVADEILNYARDNKVDLIVLASHGRTGLAHIIMGSVAMALLRRGPVPLLLVRPDHLNE